MRNALLAFLSIASRPLDWKIIAYSMAFLGVFAAYQHCQSWCIRAYDRMEDSELRFDSSIWKAAANEPSIRRRMMHDLRQQDKLFIGKTKADVLQILGPPDYWSPPYPNHQYPSHHPRWNSFSYHVYYCPIFGTVLSLYFDGNTVASCGHGTITGYCGPTPFHELLYKLFRDTVGLITLPLVGTVAVFRSFRLIKSPVSVPSKDDRQNPS